MRSAGFGRGLLRRFLLLEYLLKVSEGVQKDFFLEGSDLITGVLLGTWCAL